MLIKGHRIRNTGRTHFKKGFIPWNKGKTYHHTSKRALAFYASVKGKSRPKPKNFSEIMRKVNPPIGRKKRFDSREASKRLRVWRDGYVFVYKPDYPGSRKRPPDFGYILEHRLVMEKFLKRPIIKGEIIHHIDGCKSNNKIENLLLCENAREHNRVHNAMEIFVEGLIRKGSVFYDKENKEFRFS